MRSEPAGAFDHVAQRVARFYAINARCIDLSAHPDKCCVFVRRQRQVAPRKNRDHIARFQELVIGRRGVADGIPQVEGNQAGAQILLVEALDGGIVPVDLRRVLDQIGHDIDRCMYWPAVLLVKPASSGQVAVRSVFLVRTACIARIASRVVFLVRRFRIARLAGRVVFLLRSACMARRCRRRHIPGSDRPHRADCGELRFPRSNCCQRARSLPNGFPGTNNCG